MYVVALLPWLLCGSALAREPTGVVGSSAAAEGGQRPAFGGFDDGRLINRLAVQGGLDLGAGWQSDPGYLGVDEPALLLRPAARGAFWWQTRDLDFSLLGALQPRWYLGEVEPILQHRPDATVALELDARGSERTGVTMRGRVEADSAQRFPTARPDAFEPWAVPLWGADMADGLAPVMADLQPVVALYPEPSTALELGLRLELDQLSWLEPQRTPFGLGSELRLAAGPIVGARFDLTPDLALLARGQGGWMSWSHGTATTPGWELQAWGGLDGRVAPGLSLLVLAGWGGGELHTADLDSTISTGLLAAMELEVGGEGPRQLALGYRRGPQDLHRRDSLEHPYHLGYLRFCELDLRGLEAAVEASLIRQTPTINELPTAAGRAHGELTWWLLDELGLGAAGFFEQGVTIEDGTPYAGLRYHGGYATLRIGRVEPPAWRRPG
jgi:hypothetical protein